jgi:hypothetical protein
MVPHPTQSRLRELFNYDAQTGILTRRKRAAMMPAGSVVGTINHNGYRNVRADGRMYSAHRLIWVYQYGELPREIDHINGDGSDNCLANLRECTRSENNMNRDANRTNTSGIRCVTWRATRQTWVAIVRLNGKTAYESEFKNIEDARTAVTSARRTLHGKFCRDPA